MISTVLLLLARVCNVAGSVLVVYCVMTWFMPRTSPVMQFLSSLLDPLLMPIRGFLMRFTGMMGMDFSPLLLMLALQVARSVLVRLAFVLR